MLHLGLAIPRERAAGIGELKRVKADIASELAVADPKIVDDRCHLSEASGHGIVDRRALDALLRLGGSLHVHHLRPQRLALLWGSGDAFTAVLGSGVGEPARLETGTLLHAHGGRAQERR